MSMNKLGLSQMTDSLKIMSRKIICARTYYYFANRFPTNQTL